jgi:hypothetical protein
MEGRMLGAANCLISGAADELPGPTAPYQFPSPHLTPTRLLSDNVDVGLDSGGTYSLPLCCQG